jgi:integrase
LRSDSHERGIYKRKRHDGEYWAYRFQYEGSSYSETTDLRATQKSLPAAKRERDEHLQRVRLGQRPVAHHRIQFTEAIEKFIEWSMAEHRDHPATAKRQAVSLAAASRSFATLELGEITAGDVENFKQIRRKSEIAEVTIRKDLLAVSQVFQYAIKHRWVKENPIKQVDLPSDRDSYNERIVLPGEEAAYFAEAARQNMALHDVGRLMLWQGLRPQEVLALKKPDVDLQCRVLSVRRGKSRAAKRDLYLHEGAAALLKVRFKQPYPHLFPGGRWRYSGLPYSYSGLVNAHLAVIDVLSQGEDAIAPFDLYSFRHTFATRFYEATKDLDKLARILGHSNLATVRRYVNPLAADLRAAMEAFEKSCGFGATDDAG